MKSKGVQYEWKRILERSWENRSTVILPIVLEGAEVPSFLKERQCLYIKSSDDLSSLKKSLIEALRSSSSEGPSIRKEDLKVYRKAKHERAKQIEEALKFLRKTEEGDENE